MSAGDVLERAIEARAFPGASAETGTRAGADWTFTAGRLTYEPEAPHVTPDTVYDLASLTKVIATTSIAMRMVTRSTLALDMKASAVMPEWRDGAYADVTVRDLLEHAAGFPAWLPLYQTNKGRDEFRAAIARVAPEYVPRTKSIYSDLGFIVLGLILETAAQRPLDALFAEIREEASLPSSLDYAAREAAQAVRPATNIAPTEFDPWRNRLPAGEVHDENAFALGGIAPHAGLFGTASDVGAFARLVLRTFREDTPIGTPATMREFSRKSAVPGSSRALGWDTMLETSSCGSRMSARAIGHTGFTGTSLWIDPERDRYFVLLTNRVHPTRENNQIRAVRREFHDALGSAGR